jgi:hypothetical protein
MLTLGITELSQVNGGFHNGKCQHMNKLRIISVAKMFVAQTTLTVRRNKRISTPKGKKLCIFDGAGTSNDALNHVLILHCKKKH